LGDHPHLTGSWPEQALIRSHGDQSSYHPNPLGS